jgi:hypothetical protein
LFGGVLAGNLNAPQAPWSHEQTIRYEHPRFSLLFSEITHTGVSNQRIKHECPLKACIGRILPRRLSPGGSVFELYDRFAFLRAYLWTGRRDKLERSIDQLIGLLECVERGWPDDERSARIAIFHVCDLSAYLRQNATGVVDYQSWKRRGWRISTSSVEATVNRLIGRRLCKSQHMCWSRRGAHLLLQVRCALLNDELLGAFRRWFPEVGGRRLMLPYRWLPHGS